MMSLLFASSLCSNRLTPTTLSAFSIVSVNSPYLQGHCKRTEHSGVANGDSVSMFVKLVMHALEQWLISIAYYRTTQHNTTNRLCKVFTSTTISGYAKSLHLQCMQQRSKATANEQSSGTYLTAVLRSASIANISLLRAWWYTSQWCAHTAVITASVAYSCASAVFIIAQLVGSTGSVNASMRLAHT
jgi:hypothetical protein